LDPLRNPKERTSIKSISRKAEAMTYPTNKADTSSKPCKIKKPILRSTDVESLKKKSDRRLKKVFIKAFYLQDIFKYYRIMNWM
jgi:hypothetical protein